MTGSPAPRRSRRLKWVQAATLAAALLAASPAGAEVYRLGVDGLACPFCAYGVEKSISRLDGVERVEIDIDRGEVRVVTAAGKILSEERARQAVEAAGFTLRSFAAGESGQ